MSASHEPNDFDPAAESTAFAGPPVSEEEFLRAAEHGSSTLANNKYAGIDGERTVDENDQAEKDEERWGPEAAEGLRLMRRCERRLAEASVDTQKLVAADISRARQMPVRETLSAGPKVAKAVITGDPLAASSAAGDVATRLGRLYFSRDEWLNKRLVRYAVILQRVDSKSINPTTTVRAWPSRKRISLQPKFWADPKMTGPGRDQLSAIKRALKAVDATGMADIDNLTGEAEQYVAARRQDFP